MCGAGAALSLSGCAEQVPSEPKADAVAEPTPTPTPEPVIVSPVAQKVPLPEGIIYGLPGEGTYLAWTVDDGVSEEVIRMYGEFARDTGTRITFFINGMYKGWANQASLYMPMIKTGQIQIANHTYSHPSLTSISDSEIQDELIKNEQHIMNVYGIDPKPYYRPPYGERSERTDAAAAAVGYTCPVMWDGSLGDSGERTTEEVIEGATTWFNPQRIVLGHANLPAVTKVFPELHELITSRGLTTVTLNDYFIV